MKLFLTLFTALMIVGVFACTKKTVNNACYDADLKATMADSICHGFANGVCGCDGNTYTNECEANKAGFEIIDTIPCSQR